MRKKKERFSPQERRDSEITNQIKSKPSVRRMDQLTMLLQTHKLSIAAGDLLLLDGKWYVTHAGLLRCAKRNRCRGINVQPVHEFCDTAAARWAFKATVYKSNTCRGFVGYGDADPSNTSDLVRG